MNRIDTKLAELKQMGKKALLSFLTAGDPDLQMTEQLALAMHRGGADLIGLGVPFSDPTAESPILQRASLRSLQGGTTLQSIFELAGRLRQQLDIPLLFMIYANMIFHYGSAEFFSACRQYGIDGVVVPDLPYEERGEFEPYAEAEGVYCIRMVAPAERERISTVVYGAKGFIYCVAAPGHEPDENTASSFASTIQEVTDVPMLFETRFDEDKLKNRKIFGNGVIVADEIMEKIFEMGCQSIPVIEEIVSALKVNLQ